jgi:hypothetical protein
MFVRVKKTGNYSYTQIVENYREDGKVKQRIIATLGQYEALSESGKLDALARSLLKYTTAVRAVDALRDGSMRARRTLKLGPAIVFERLWRELGIAEVWTFSVSVDRKLSLPQNIGGREYGRSKAGIPSGAQAKRSRVATDIGEERSCRCTGFGDRFWDFKPLAA